MLKLKLFLSLLVAGGYCTGYFIKYKVLKYIF